MTRLLNRKIIVVAVTLALFAGSIFGPMNIGSSLMPSMDSTQMTMTIKMPQGSSMEETASMTDTVMKKVKEIKDVDSVAGMISSGSSGISSMTSGGSSNEDQSSMYVLLKEKKKHTNKEIKKEILKKTKKFDCEVEVQESSMDMSALGGSGISVQIKGNDLNKLRSIGKDIAQIVEDTKGTQNISNGSEETTPDLHVVVDKKKAVKNGLTVATIYQQLSEKLKDASEATTITINEKEYSVNVGNSAKNTLTRDDLKKVKLTGTVSGKEKEVTFSLVLSKLLKKNIYTAQEKENIKVAFPMGLCMISEGVIPIAMNDIIRTVICTATGCGVTGAISFSLDVGSKVPSGGVFVIPAMSNPLAALIALLAGTAVTGVLLVLIKKKKTEEDEPMVDEKEEDLDLSGFTIS